MKVLFYSTYHFNTETFGPYLEMIQNHINAGDDVTFLSCHSELSSCQTNPFHTNLICKTCISTRVNGLSTLTSEIKQISLNEVLCENDFDPQLQLIDSRSVQDFKNVKFESFDIGMAVLSSVVSIFRDPSPDFNIHKALIEKQWKSSMWVYNAVKKLIDDEQFELVYVFNARFATLRACLRACEEKGVNCNVLEEGRSKSFYAIYPNKLPHSIEFNVEMINDYWEKGNDNKAEEAFEYYLNRSKSKDARFGYFTSAQEAGKLPENWDDQKNNIAIFISSEDEFVAIGKEWENRLYKNQVDAIEKITSSFINDNEYVFYVRVHPNLLGILNESIISLYEIMNKNVVIIPANSPVSTYSLMFAANKIISFGSSVGIEAAAFEKISILAGQSFYKDLGSTFNPQNHEELVAMLKEKVLIPQPTLGALKYAYFLMNFGIEYKHFKRLNPFEATMNGKKVKPAFLYYMIRRVGRWKRIKKEARIKKLNIEKLKAM